MKIILIVLISLLMGQDTTATDTTIQFLGTATDTSYVIAEFALSTGEIRWKLLKRIRLQDRWVDSKGDLKTEYYENIDKQWIKINPNAIFRVTPIKNK